MLAILDLDVLQKLMSSFRSASSHLEKRRVITSHT